MAVRSELRLVLTSRQLLVALVAATLCSDANAGELGELEERRVPLGPEFATLCRRLTEARMVDGGSGASVVSLLDSDGQPMIAVEIALPRAATVALRVATERMRGMFVWPGGSDELLASDVVNDELDCILALLT